MKSAFEGTLNWYHENSMALNINKLFSGTYLSPAKLLTILNF